MSLNQYIKPMEKILDDLYRELGKLNMSRDAHVAIQQLIEQCKKRVKELEE